MLVARGLIVITVASVASASAWDLWGSTSNEEDIGRGSPSNAGSSTNAADVCPQGSVPYVHCDFFRGQEKCMKGINTGAAARGGGPCEVPSRENGCMLKLDDVRQAWMWASDKIDNCCNCFQVEVAAFPCPSGSVPFQDCDFSGGKHQCDKAVNTGQAAEPNQMCQVPSPNNGCMLDVNMQTFAWEWRSKGSLLEREVRPSYPAQYAAPKRTPAATRVATRVPSKISPRPAGLKPSYPASYSAQTRMPAVARPSYPTSHGAPTAQKAGQRPTAMKPSHPTSYGAAVVKPSYPTSYGAPSAQGTGQRPTAMKPSYPTSYGAPATQRAGQMHAAVKPSYPNSYGAPATQRAGQMPAVVRPSYPTPSSPPQGKPATPGVAAPATRNFGQMPAGAKRSFPPSQGAPQQNAPTTVVKVMPASQHGSPCCNCYMLTSFSQSGRFGGLVEASAHVQRRSNLRQKHITEGDAASMFQLSLQVGEAEKERPEL